MKLIIEDAVGLDGSIQDELNESSGATERNYYLSGVFSTPDTKNRNGRIYSRAIWEREVAAYNKEIKNKTINTLGEYQHPPRSTVDPMKAVMRITELGFKDDGQVWGKCKILNNNSKETNAIKGLIKEGIKIGVSTRGVGKVSATGVVEEYKMITADLVDMPSNYGSDLTGVIEGVQLLNGIVQDKEYSIDENGCIGEACSIMTESRDSKEISKKLKELNYELASSMGGQKIYHKKGEKPYTDMVIVKGKDVKASNPETQKLLSEYNTMTESREDNEPCPIQEKITEAISTLKKDIIQDMLEHVEKFNEDTKESLIESISDFLVNSKEVQEEVQEVQEEIQDIGDNLEKPVLENAENIDKESKKSLDLETAKTLIEALKKVEKVDEKTVDNLVKLGILSKEEFKKAMNFKDNCDSFEEFKDEFPNMKASALRIFQDLF